MKKSALILFAAIFLTACSSNPIKGNFKAQMVNGNKTTIVEEMVEETTVGLLGESTKKILKRNQKDSVSIELNSDNSYSDENISLKFNFSLNYFEVDVKNLSNSNIEYLCDYAYFKGIDDEKYNLICESNWKDPKEVIRSQNNITIQQDLTTTLNLTPMLNLDYSLGTSLDSVHYWRQKNLLSTAKENPVKKDYVEIMLPFKRGNEIYTYQFKLHLLRQS